jgi:hypothetical protein
MTTEKDGNNDAAKLGFTMESLPDPAVLKEIDGQEGLR